MNSAIRVIKEQSLKSLEQAKAKIESEIAILVEKKYAIVKVDVDEKCKALDSALAAYIAEKQKELNEEIASKRQEVADKKANIENEARDKARKEAEEESAANISEFEKAIASLKKELEE